MYRQVHPTHCLKELSSGAFRPTPSDKDQLSVDCSNMITAQAAYELHLKKTKLDKSTGERSFLQSAGTWALSRSDFSKENLPVSHAPVKDEEHQPDNPSHHLVDYSSIIPKNPAKPGSKNENVAKRLKLEAIKYGKQWPKHPEAGEATDFFL